jgi:hypothetical protein
MRYRMNPAFRDLVGSRSRCELFQSATLVTKIDDLNPARKPGGDLAKLPDATAIGLEPYFPAPENSSHRKPAGNFITGILW